MTTRDGCEAVAAADGGRPAAVARPPDRSDGATRAATAPERDADLHSGTTAADAEPPPPSRLLRLYPALGNPDFRLFWLGMLPATLAWQMSVVAAPYAAFTLADSATVLGLVSLATGLPLLGLSLVGGVVADRLPRRRILIATQGTLGLGAAALAALTLSGTLQVWHLIALGAVQGVAFAFNMPARQAYVAELVGRPLIRNAVALNNAGMNFCRVAGPSLAGVLLAVPAIGVGGVFVVMTMMYGLVILSLFRLPNDALTMAGGTSSNPDANPPSGLASSPAGRRASGWADLLEGLAYIRSSPTLLTLFGMGFLALFFGMPFQTLMPVFAERVYGVGAAGLGILMAAVGVGALGGSLVVATFSSSPHAARLQIGFGVGFGLALVGFGLAPSFPVAVVMLTLVGLLSSAYSALNNTLVMGNTAPHLYGRVMSVHLMTFATMPLGAFPMAWLADHVGGQAVVIGDGLIVAAAVGGIALLFPAFRQIR